MTLEIFADKDELNFPPSIQVVEALNTMNIDILRRYQKDPKLIEVLSKKHDVPKEQIFLEQGIMGIIHRVFDYGLTPDSSVLLPEFGYPQYQKVARYNKATVNTFQFKDKKAYDLDDILRKLERKPNVLVLIDPESPLGFSISNEGLEQIIKAVDESTIIMLDQAHEGFRENHIKDATKLVKEHPNLLVARGFSKFYGLAGVRVAYALCGSKVKEMINFQERYLGFDGVAQQVAMAALQSEKHYKQNVALIRKEKEKFNDSVEKLPGYSVLQTDSIFSVVQVPEEQSKFLRWQAREVRISIRHLEDYHDGLKNFYRVTMCPSEQMERVIDLFNSVSWLYGLKVYNSDAPSIIDTREQGYSVHRKEIPCEKSGVLMGLHRIIVPPGKDVPAHSHRQQDEIFEFYSPAIVEINDMCFNVETGDIINVKPGDIHYVKAPANRFLRYFAQRFPYLRDDKYSISGKQVIHEKK